ncbi:hypothetical protein LTS08_001724 [Lithohypha guttulata]|nr:hypothetical protein LTS08_001724 [Lithohypha guttulata]
MAQTTTDNLHRKVELQSYADLTYLQQNLAKAAREKLDLHFPPQHSARQAAPADVITLGGAPAEPEAQPGEDKENEHEEANEDPLRKHVRHLVDSFLQETFSSAAHSISINGIDASSLPHSQVPTCSNPSFSPDEAISKPLDSSEEIEGIHYTYGTFDSKAAKRVQTLYAELETLTTQVSKLRREAPKASADAYAAQLEAAVLADDENWIAEQARLQKESHQRLELDPLRDGWNEDVKDVYTRGVHGLAVLSGLSHGEEGSGREMVSLTETVGKVQRARGVAMEFE